MATPHGDQIRCSDQDRAVVERVLADAFTDGRITREEHEERLEAVWNAKTFQDLRPLTADLVAVEQRVRQEFAPKPTDGYPRALVDPLQQNSRIDHISVLLGSKNRIGAQWRLRPRTAVRVWLGESNLDLTKAVFEADRCVISLSIIMGEVNLRVPAGVRVRDELSSSIMAEVNLKGLVHDDGPEIILTGNAIMAEVNVIGPEYRGWKKRKWQLTR